MAALDGDLEAEERRYLFRNLVWLLQSQSGPGAGQEGYARHGAVS
jgi:hypothetical protein